MAIGHDHKVLTQEVQDIHYNSLVQDGHVAWAKSAQSVSESIKQYVIIIIHADQNITITLGARGPNG